MKTNDSLSVDQHMVDFQEMLGFAGELELVPLKAQETVLVFRANDSAKMTDPKRLRTMPGFNPRLKTQAHRDHVRRIADSMKAEGFYGDKPLAVVSGYEGVGNKRKPVWFVTEGGCRWEALQMALAEGAPIELVPVSIKPRSTSMEDLTVALVKGNEGKPFTPLELAVIVNRMEKFDRSAEYIAEKLNFSLAYVQQLQALARVPSSIRAMIEAGEVPAAVALESIRQHGTDAKDVLQDAVDKAKASGATKITRKNLPQQVFKRTVRKAAPKLLDVVSQLRTHKAYAGFPSDLRARLDELMEQIEAVRPALAEQDAVNDKQLAIEGV